MKNTLKLIPSFYPFLKKYGVKWNGMSNLYYKYTNEMECNEYFSKNYYVFLKTILNTKICKMLKNKKQKA